MRKITIRSLLAFVLAVAISFSTVMPANAAGALGIDVSKYNGGINWNAVKSQGVSYAFIKVGSTKSGLDPYFAANVRGAQAAGIRTGVYIYSYANNVQEAANEAAQVLAWIEQYGINFPVAYDIENSNHKNLDASTVTAMCNAFCDVIYSAGYTPLVYTYANFFKSHIISSQLKYGKWVAQYGTGCDIPGYTIWQYSSKGSLSGMNGDVDLNTMAVDLYSAIPHTAFVKSANGTVNFFSNYRRTKGWVQVDGGMYHLADNFVMDTGWYQDSTGTYYLDNMTGKALTGLQSIGTNRYYFAADGKMQTGIISLNNKLYVFSPQNGAMMTGWVTASNGNYYFGSDGAAVTGMAQIGNGWYCFGNDGVMVTGFQNINGSYYFFNPSNGMRMTGFQTINGQLYCFDQNGRLQFGWIVQNDGNRTIYYADNNGRVLSGLQTINGDTYLFAGTLPAMQKGYKSVNGHGMFFDDENGKLKRNCWVNVNEKNYFVDNNGYIVTGFQQLGSKYYYFDNSGIMKTGIITINNKRYYFDTTSGALQTGWIQATIKDNDVTLYGQADGSLATTTIMQINGNNYAFDSNSYLVEGREIRINNINYSADDYGIITVIN